MKVPEPRKLPSDTWFIQLRLNGVSVSVTAPTEKECRDAAQLIKAEHRAGKRQIQKSIGNITLTQGIDNYISARSNVLSPETIRGYRTIQRNRFKAVANKPIKSIDNWQTICNRESLLCSAKTMKNSWMFVASVIKECGYVPPKIKLPQIVQKERPFLEPDQIQLFVKAVSGESCEIPALLALCSLRRSEICGLKWENVDLKKRRILVSGAAVFDENNKLVQKETNKNNSSRRYVPVMINELYDALNACPNKTGLLIQCNPATIWAQINQVCKANDLPKVGIHGLRHSFASLAYHLGVPEKVAMQIGGWGNFEIMRKIYTHLAQADIGKNEQQLSGFFNSANKKANENKKTSVFSAYEV